jgi:hypothetical protein
MMNLRDRKLMRNFLPVGLLLLASSHGTATAQVDVLTQHNDNARTGVNTAETILRPANVRAGQFGMLFKRSVDDQLYTQPLIVTGVLAGGGTRDLVYVTTVNNSVYAFDANDDQASSPVWHVNFGMPADVNSADFGCLDINGKMGIIGTPVIDKSRDALYVVSLTQTSSGDGQEYIQRLHALDLATGADLPNSPVVIQARDFDPLMENQRPALMLANGMVYVGYASHCDKQPYHGFLMTYDARTLRQVDVLNTSPTGSAAAIWQSGQGPASDEDGNVYVVTGNGSWDGAKNFSESFLKLTPHLKLLDWFTPTNHFELDHHDEDVDSSGATLIPGTHLVLGGGKQGVLYSLDTRHLGHLGDENSRQHFHATASHLHSLVYWRSEAQGDLLYVWGQRDKAKVYKLQGDRLQETAVQMRDLPNQGHPGAMLSLSANGHRDGILWAAIHATGDSWHESRPGVLHAYEANDIRKELWNSLESPSQDDCGKYSKMAPPTIANGHVYLASFGSENTGTGQLCVYGPLATRDASHPTPPLNVKADVKQGHLSLTWSPVDGASFYRVSRSSSLESAEKIVGVGLTSLRYVGPAPQHGEAVHYRVFAITPEGIASAGSSVELPPSRSAPRE